MEFKKEGNTLTIKMELGQGVPSRKGGNLVVASSYGFVPIEGTDLRINLNVIKART